MPDAVGTLALRSTSITLNAAAALSDHSGLAIDSVQMGKAELRYDPTMTNPAQIIAAVRAAGYEAAAGGAVGESD